MRERVNMETATMVYRSITNDTPNYLSTLFERLSQNTIKELRNTKTDLRLPLPKTSNCQKCFSYRGARLWNNLSANVKGAQTQYQFKKICKISRESFLQRPCILSFRFSCIITYSSQCNFVFLYDCNLLFII